MSQPQDHQNTHTHTHIQVLKYNSIFIINFSKSVHWVKGPSSCHLSSPPVVVLVQQAGMDGLIRGTTAKMMIQHKDQGAGKGVACASAAVIRRRQFPWPLRKSHSFTDPAQPNPTQATGTWKLWLNHNSPPSLRSTNIQSVCVSLHCSTITRAGMRACLYSRIYHISSPSYFSHLQSVTISTPELRIIELSATECRLLLHTNLSPSRRFQLPSPFFNLFSGLISTPWMMKLIMEIRGGSNL